MGALDRGRPGAPPPFGRRVALVARDPGEVATGGGGGGRRGRPRGNRGAIRRMETPPPAPSRLHRQRGAARRARGSLSRERRIGRRLLLAAALSDGGTSRLQGPDPQFPPGSWRTEPRALRSVGGDPKGRPASLAPRDPADGRIDPP